MQFLAIESPASRVPLSAPAQLAQLLYIAPGVIACGEIAQIFTHELIQTLTHRSGDLACSLDELLINR